MVHGSRIYIFSIDSEEGAYNTGAEMRVEILDIDLKEDTFSSTSRFRSRYKGRDGFYNVRDGN